MDILQNELLMHMLQYLPINDLYSAAFKHNAIKCFSLKLNGIVDLGDFKNRNKMVAFMQTFGEHIEGIVLKHSDENMAVLLFNIEVYCPALAAFLAIDACYFNNEVIHLMCQILSLRPVPSTWGKWFWVNRLQRYEWPKLPGIHQ